MTRTLEMSLSETSIEAVIRELEAYQKALDSKCELLCRKLAEIGLSGALLYLNPSHTIPTNGTPIEGNITVEKQGNGYVVQAASDHVFFVEFGTGVYAEEKYPYSPSPNAIHKGDYWLFHAGDRNYWTKGQRAKRFMGNAAVDIRQQLGTVAKEVFGGKS